MSDQSPSNMTPAKRAYLDQRKLEDAQRNAESASQKDDRIAALAEILANKPPMRELRPRPEYVEQFENIDRWKLWEAALIPQDFQQADLAILPEGLPDDYLGAVAR